MRNLLFAVTFAAIAIPAKADTVTITLTAVSGTCSTPCSKTFTDASNTLTSKLIADYGPLCQAQNLVGSPPVPTACTAAQTLVYWANSLAQGTVANMATLERQAAAAAAAAAISQLNPQ